ncbi:transposase [Paraburkholderia sp. RL18-085-BIA-A]|uniref:transposase n=1 Tax=Paraburkholderia sp. RL18-085-BIA-A TaxID=3031633 RepID=UPI0038BD2C45
MKKFARTLRAHRELILNYFHPRKQFSSGIVEGLNNQATRFNQPVFDGHRVVCPARSRSVA